MMGSCVIDVVGGDEVEYCEMLVGYCVVFGFLLVVCVMLFGVLVGVVVVLFGVWLGVMLMCDMWMMLCVGNIGDLVVIVVVLGWLLCGIGSFIGVDVVMLCCDVFVMW